MAKYRRRRRMKKNLLDYIAIPRIDLDPETKKSIRILLLLAFGAVSFLSLFGLAGSAGEWLLKILILVFGYGKWLFPVIILALVYIMYNEDKYYIRGTNYLGLIFFIVSFQSLLHFFIEKEEWKVSVQEGVGGGYTGMYLAQIFSGFLGFWGGMIVLLCLFLGSLVLIFDTSLTRLIGSESLFAKVLSPIHAFFKRLLGGRSEEEEGLEIEEDLEEVEEEGDDEEDGEESSGDDEEEIEEGGQAVGFSRRALGAVPALLKTEKKIKEKSGWKQSNIKIDLPIDLLNGKSGKAGGGDLKQRALVIQRTLENFGIPVEMGEISVGPTVTQYTFKPAEGIKLAKITTLSNDLALALAAHPIRIEAPIPGKALVGVEVPNQTKAMVGLKELMLSSSFKERKTPLMLALGKDVSGMSWSYDLCKMPHLLVAGATNSGKSVCLNSIIIGLLYQNNPDDLKFIMVDPKRVELPVYNGIPHLLTPVITDVGKTINALKWCLNEMDRRFEILSSSGRRNIQAYNEKAKEKMPYLVFVIDELADLMVTASKDIEASVIRLAQMSRAVGIHLILATQRPSVDVITGLIKANMPARIAFSVASGTDSKTILDSLGAEKLLGQGDMLFLTAEISKPKRLQGAFVSDIEIRKVVNYIKEKSGEPEYEEGITDRQKVKGIGGVGLDGGGGDQDDLFEEAKEIIINSGKASASLLQRRLSVGYARAARILDELEEVGVIGPSNGAKPRDILITKEQYAAMANTGVSGAGLHNRDESEALDDYLGNESPETPTVFSSGNDSEEEDDDNEEEHDEELDDEEELAEDNNEEEEEEEAEEDLQTKKEKTPKSATDEFVQSELEGEDEEEENTKDDSENLDEDEGMFFSK